jgi:superoxide oxidase
LLDIPQSCRTFGACHAVIATAIKLLKNHLEVNMSWKNSAQRYGSVSIALHWIMAILMVGVYACIELHEVYGRTPRGAMFENWHTMLGLSILLLVVLRLGLRFVQPTPVVTPPLVNWQHKLAILMHLALYIFMLVMPVIGWVLLSAEGHKVMFFGLQLPALATADRAFADSVAEVHEVIGTLGYVLVGLHTAAALLHHYIIKDNTLLRILPRKGE